MTTTTDDVAPSASTAAAPRWVLLSEEAEVRGFRNTLAFKRWCLKRKVTLKRDGRKLWVSPGEVDRAVDELPAREVGPADESSTRTDLPEGG